MKNTEGIKQRLYKMLLDLQVQIPICIVTLSTILVVMVLFNQRSEKQKFERYSMEAVMVVLKNNERIDQQVRSFEVRLDRHEMELAQIKSLLNSVVDRLKAEEGLLGMTGQERIDHYEMELAKMGSLVKGVVDMLEAEESLLKMTGQERISKVDYKEEPLP